MPKSLGFSRSKKTFFVQQSPHIKVWLVPFKWHTSLWKNFLISKYLKNSSFFEVSGKPTDSWFWKGLIKQRDFVKESFCFQINNGTSTRVWVDPWVPGLHSLKTLPNPNNPNIEPNMKVAELTLEEPRRWNTIFLQALFTLQSVDAIQKILLSSYNYSSIGDKINWIHHSFSISSVTSAYAVINNTQVPTPMQHTDNSWKKLWKLKIQDILKLFLWKVMHNILPTRSLLKDLSL